MKKKALYALCISFCFIVNSLLSQNQTNKWYFGAQAGLDFMTNPPTVLTNGTMTAMEGCATMSDANGNLLFYTNGVKVWNQNHMVMANGTSLSGHISSSQGVIIEKQPGNNNLYYIFTLDGPNVNPNMGFCYSIVDMSLAAGMGSVTAANLLLSPQTTTERMTSTRHCNGIDTWIIIQEYASADFKAFLLTASGINPVPVVSTTSPALSQLAYMGCMKASPNGKKIAFAAHGPGFYLFDFDNSTGAVSNALNLFPDDTNIFSYGIEFSPGGTKLYGSAFKGKALYQWDLCAATNTAIVASRVTVHSSTTIAPGSIQRASDGKIYVARNAQQELGVINNPDLSGTSCNYVELGISVATKTVWLGLPNFNLQYRQTPAPFTFTQVNCSQVAFSNAVLSPTAACANAASYSLTNQVWNFGDPASGSANTSTLSNPTHTFTATGTYTTQLILYYSCGGGTDTLKKTITTSPCTGINKEILLNKEALKVFPNPTSRYVFIQSEAQVQVLVLNQQGQLILRQTYKPGLNKMDIEGLSNGLYFIKLISETETTTTRLIKTTE